MTTSYDVQVSANSDMSSPVIDTNVASLPYTVPAPLSDGTWYRQARKHTTTGVGPWSDIVSFVVTDPLIDFIAANSGLSVYWPFDDTGGLVARAINPAVSLGRNLVQDPGFDTGTPWSLGANTTISSGKLHAAGATASTTQTNLGLVVNRAYQVEFTVSNYSGGSVRIVVGTSGNGTTRSANGTYIETIVCVGSAGISISFPSSATLDVDDISVQQIEIRASSAFPNLELVSNGGFNYDAYWTKGANWAISGGVATHTPGSTATLSQTSFPIRNTRNYDITFTVSGRTAGTITPKVGATSTGTTRSSNGTFTETIAAAGTATLSFTPDTNFDGSINDVSVVPSSGLVMIDGDMETAGTGYWGVLGSALLTKDATAPHSGSTNMRVTRNGVNSPSAVQVSLVPGERYYVSCWVKSDGVTIPRVLDINSTIGAVGTTSTSWQLIEGSFFPTSTALILQATNATVDGQYADFDDLVVTKISGTSAQVTGADINQAKGNALITPAYYFDGTGTDVVNIYSSQLNSIWHPQAFTIAMQVLPETWSWGTPANIFLVRGNDVNYFIQIRQPATTGELECRLSINSTVDTITASGLTETTDLLTLHVTFDGSNVLTLYVDGQEIGHVTASGAFSNTGLSSTLCVIGATTTSGGSPFHGWISHPRIYNYAMTADEVLAEAQLSGRAS
jgi:Concanavalin A-like lectin/glucanases superfamily